MNDKRIEDLSMEMKVCYMLCGRWADDFNPTTIRQWAEGVGFTLYLDIHKIMEYVGTPQYPGMKKNAVESAICKAEEQIEYINKYILNN